MGHAWCKERTTKAQDSKSPLDRVFVRCAHRIYPNLKEEGSVLGGATQRVTSSEIGYAESPPREVLTRGRSIDSVDRPFHPSDWVDVNLEVPSSPRTSSVATNLTIDTNLCPATSPTSSCSNLKDVTPVPPPRRRKRNRGRPLPPKPDEALENSSSNSKPSDHSGEPLYSSVKSPKSSGDEKEEEERVDKSEPRRTKEIYEHKVNGTGKVIPSGVVSAKTTARSEERKSWRSSELSHQHRKIPENEEYESFVRNQLVKDSSTPNHDGKRKSKKIEKQIEDKESGATTCNARPKNYSTVSLPNYDELELDRHSGKEINEDIVQIKEKAKPKRPVRCSTVSLPAENCLSPFSEKTSVRLEDYIASRDSIENVPTYQVLDKLDTENGMVADEFMKYDSNKLEDWDLSDISNCELNHQRRLSHEFPSLVESADKENRSKGEDVVDFMERGETHESGRKSLPHEKISDRYVTRSTVTLQKPEGFGKTPSPILDDHSRGSPDWMVNQNGSHLRYFGPPTMENTCRSSSACETSSSPTVRKPFFLDEEKHCSVQDTIGGGSCRNGAITEESDRSEQSRMIFSRSLSNESEPYDDAYESKELRGHSGKLIKTISEESLPREMLEDVDRELDDSFDEKLAKDIHNKMKKDCIEPNTIVKTPPPSPEPKIKAEILENDHSTLLKVLKEEAAEESNLSSMTPSLTELEAALSDMLEKEEPQEGVLKHEESDEVKIFEQTSSKSIEPEIVPIEKNRASFADISANIIRKDMSAEIHGRMGDKALVDEDLGERMDEIPISPGQMLDDRKLVTKCRKVSFCAWEETGMTETDLRSDPEFIAHTEALGKDSVSEQDNERTTTDCTGYTELSRTRTEIPMSSVEGATCHLDPPPEKPSRLHRNLEDLLEHTENVPTPPRRKNRSSIGVGKQEVEATPNGSAPADTYSNDRLI